MGTFTIVAMAFLFLFVGVQWFAQAGEKAQMETKGEVNAKAETDKEIGQLKALAEGAQGNQAKGTMEPAKGENKVTEKGVEGTVKPPKAKPK